MKLFRMILIGMFLCGAFGAKLGAFLMLSGWLKSSQWPVIELGFGVGVVVGIIGALVVSVLSSDAIKESSNQKERATSTQFATDKVMG